MSTTTPWQAKTAAWAHDPPEKALVLLRDPLGHEGGTVKAMVQAVFGAEGIPEAVTETVRRADHWASAADRPQWPNPAEAGRFARWSQVRFTDTPELIHPLSGARYALDRMADVDLQAVKSASLKHLTRLIHRDPQTGEVDHKRTLLALWRFGPDMPIAGLSELMRLLPADTRVPDHSIWEHLDLTSALAGAMAVDPEQRPALLIVSLGPVQAFIAAARSTSDLWAGSHFLSTLAWEAMQVVVDAYGPDAIVFPNLRGVPIVDLWLHGQGVTGFDRQPWMDRATDANPLFAAALPNKFLAIVPADQAERIGSAIETHVRDWVQREARVMLSMALKAIGETADVDDRDHPDLTCYRQLVEQLAGFPEVHWATVPWPVTEGATASWLPDALRTFYPHQSGDPGYFGTAAYQMLREPKTAADGWRFFTPNPGTLYPALHDLAERLLAAAKSVRHFDQLAQHGYRDSLAGEAEWLRLNDDSPDTHPDRRDNTLWNRLASKRPSWVKAGEHLGALGLIKRLWPSRFCASIRDKAPEGSSLREQDIKRFVVSTHTMALTGAMAHFLETGEAADDDAFTKLTESLGRLERDESVALPRGLVELGHKHADRGRLDIVRRLPALLDRDDADAEDLSKAAGHKLIRNALGTRPDTYYALLLMDGDQLGAWVSGADDKRITYGDAWHQKIRRGVDAQVAKHDPLSHYLNALRPVSPARHAAISSALNGFALHLAAYAVESICMGRLIYAGGDDVLAMVPVRYLTRCMWWLRLIYSGTEAPKTYLHDGRLQLGQGFARLDRRLYRTMGERATASMGALIVHHQRPLQAALADVRQAEKNAKNAGRDAWCLTIDKRGGGATTLTLPWTVPGHCAMGTFMDLAMALATPDISRRIAYAADTWLGQIEGSSMDDPKAMEGMVSQLLRREFERHGARGGRALAAKVVSLAFASVARKPDGGKHELAPCPLATLRALLACAEFLGREGGRGLASAPSAVEASDAY